MSTRAKDGRRIGRRSENGQTRLNPNDHPAIRTARSVGMSVQQIAAIYGVHRSRIYQLLGEDVGAHLLRVTSRKRRSA